VSCKQCGDSYGKVLYGGLCPKCFRKLPKEERDAIKAENAELTGSARRAARRSPTKVSAFGGR